MNVYRRRFSGFMLGASVTLTAQASERFRPHYRLRFLDKKRTIWVMASEPLVLDIQGDLVFEQFGQGDSVSYIFAGTGTIKSKNLVVLVTPDDIVVNGDKLGKHLNATVDPNGEVRLGEFVPTFR
jgi:hypothetical protein